MASIENVNGNKSIEKKKIFKIEVESQLAEAMHQYCKAKQWNENYFVINAITKELIEELGFIQHCGDFLNEKGEPIDFSLYRKSMNIFFDKTWQDINRQ